MSKNNNVSNDVNSKDDLAVGLVRVLVCDTRSKRDSVCTRTNLRKECQPSLFTNILLRVRFIDVLKL